MPIKQSFTATTNLPEGWNLQGAKQQVLLVGPYISNYSFAKMNRGLMMELAKMKNSDFEFRIWEHPGRWVDKLPSKEDLKNFPEVANMLTSEPGEPEITIFNSFPSNPAEPYGMADLPGKFKILYIAWEETIYPADKVQEVNENMHMVWATTSHVKRILRQNGVKIPIEIVPVGLDNRFTTYNAKQYALSTKKKVKFLHISSARVRKGVDLMLEAYFDQFTGDDDVSLIIKSFPGPDNLVNDLVGKLRKEHTNPPEVIHIFNPDLTEEDIIDLMHSTDASVYPTRAEGFGMPILEAMYMQHPVIVTGYSGHMDFCNSENSLLLGYKIVDANNSELSNIGAKWAEPDITDLKSHMRFVYENINGEELSKIGEAARTAASEYTWAKIARKAAPLLNELMQIGYLKTQTLAVVSTYNSVSGIAEYSRDLYNPIESSFAKIHFLANKDASDQVRPDSQSVVRLWEQGATNPNETLTWLKENTPDILQIQYHSGEMSPSYLLNLVLETHKLLPQTQIFITPHDTLSKAALSQQALEAYAAATKILVHKKQDLEVLQKHGLTNLVEFELPYDEYTIWPKRDLRIKLGLENFSPILVTHGIASFHKGLLQTADAVAELKQKYPNTLWLAVNAVNINNGTSSDTIDKLREKVTALGLEENVRIFTDFLDAQTVLALIESADIGLLAYDEVGESASAAVRKFLASGTPTIVTDIPIMSELKNEVLKIEDNSPEKISEAVSQLIENPNLAEKIATAALAKSRELSWEKQARKMLAQFNSASQPPSR